MESILWEPKSRYNFVVVFGTRSVAARAVFGTRGVVARATACGVVVVMNRCSGNNHASPTNCDSPVERVAGSRYRLPLGRGRAGDRRPMRGVGHGARKGEGEGWVVSGG